MGLIYKITNKTNNKMYIGLTTRTFEERMTDYRFAATSPVDYPSGILAAIKKYGFDNFIFEIVEGNLDNDEILDEKEIYYIKYFGTKAPQGYNISDGGRGDIQLIGKKNAKPVMQINPITLEIISVEPTLTKMAEKLDIGPSNISAICNLKEGHYIAKDYTFAFVKNFDRAALENHLSKRYALNNKSNGVEVFYLGTGEIIGTYLTAYKAGQELNIPDSNLYHYLNGDRSIGGYYNEKQIGIRYINDPKTNAIAELKRKRAIITGNAAKDIELSNPEMDIVFNYIVLWEMINEKEWFE